MNWLAHLFLSEPDPAFRVGSLLPDLAPVSQLGSLLPAMRLGVQRHRRIDAFTDSHPVVRQSMRRIGPSLRRFAGVLVDIFYDHVLAREWNSYSSAPLDAFAAEVYASFAECRRDLPGDLFAHLDKIRMHDFLCSYRDLDGITEALRRIGLRLRRPVDLTAGAAILAGQYDEFHADFRAFFPALRHHLSTIENLSLAPDASR